jgi:hypothetical protein
MSITRRLLALLAATPLLLGASAYDQCCHPPKHGVGDSCSLLNHCPGDLHCNGAGLPGTCGGFGSICSSDTDCVNGIWCYAGLCTGDCGSEKCDSLGATLGGVGVGASAPGTAADGNTTVSGNTNGTGNGGTNTTVDGNANGIENGGTNTTVDGQANGAGNNTANANNTTIAGGTVVVVEDCHECEGAQVIPSPVMEDCHECDEAHAANPTSASVEDEVSTAMAPSMTVVAPVSPAQTYTGSATQQHFDSGAVLAIVGAALVQFL